MRESRSSRTLRPPGCAALASDTIAEPPRFHLGYPARSFTSITPRESTETTPHRGFAAAGTATPVSTVPQDGRAAALARSLVGTQQAFCANCSATLLVVHGREADSGVRLALNEGLGAGLVYGDRAGRRVVGGSQRVVPADVEGDH